MFPNRLRHVKFNINLHLRYTANTWYTNTARFHCQSSSPQKVDVLPKEESPMIKDNGKPLTNGDMRQTFPMPRVIPMILTNKETVVLSFDDVPGPKALKYLSIVRQYLSQIGTQLTAGILTIGLNIAQLSTDQRLRQQTVRALISASALERLINHPDHIQKVYLMEGESPVRSTLDSLEKYRVEHKHQVYGGLYSVHGQGWICPRELIYNPLHNADTLHIHGVNDVCENFTQKVYNMRNHQDEVPKDLYNEIHKWAFDCIGLIVFSKKFTMLDTELVYSQCDMSWLYHSLEKATDAILKCESGLHLWKLFATPSWRSLVKYCDSLDNLIGKHVMEAEQSFSLSSITNNSDPSNRQSSLIDAMLFGEEKMSADDVATVIMDMLLIGVNTITSSMSFLLYNLSKHQRCQKLLFEEIGNMTVDLKEIHSVKQRTPYLQACIKENLRLVPPIPVLTRILSKNIVLDRYNIPRGTLIIMSTQDAALKESNYEDAATFKPERWLNADAKDYHAFASIPFGYGSKRCVGQNIAETMMTLLTIRLIQKYKLEYHYGDIEPTKTFIAKPNRALKIRFIDRI